MLPRPHPLLIRWVCTFFFHPGSNPAKVTEFLRFTRCPQAKLRKEEAMMQVIKAPKPDISLIVKLLLD